MITLNTTRMTAPLWDMLMQIALEDHEIGQIQSLVEDYPQHFTPHTAPLGEYECGRGYCLLARSARAGSVDAFRYLRGKGIDLLAVSLDCDNARAVYVIEEAAMSESLDIIQDVLQEINSRDGVFNPEWLGEHILGCGLRAAALAGKARSAELILAHPLCPVDEPVRGGEFQTALMIAAEHGHAEVVKLLLKAGASRYATCGDYEGSTAKDLARRYDRKEVLALFD